MTDEMTQQEASSETTEELTSREIIQKMIDKFGRKMARDEMARAEVEPIVKTLNIDLGDETFNLKLEHAEVTVFEDGLLEQADITLKTTKEYLGQIVDGTLRPMRAYVTKKIVIKGKIEDIMHLKKMF